ncbi:Fpg/Nei family DNA glycosylase [Agrococcus sediminis]|uniref:DNA-(apurinic or apyrimidinic site) lyase n=1 Tax=Agrococcus sediminis TaxID=2599924 RepID=A0A5M8QJS3_9MICO|nr:DNA-formamidopyrimidine glycosylase family protein [Agrococcus sediminis]KAA6436335.1 Fpg/Nei family DNA glycosylase [Agrococcus sediminis]
MPEGDTIYRAAVRLGAAMAGRELLRSDFRVPSLATADLAGERIDEVRAVGKHLLMRGERFTIHSHAGMDGLWHVLEPGRRAPVATHTIRVVLATDQHEIVGSSLPVLELLPRAGDLASLDYLGPDLLDEGWDEPMAAEAARRLRATGAPVGVALLDQHAVAGLGNVYRGELCFLRGVHPATPVGEVDVERLVALARRLMVANRERTERTFTGDTRNGRRTWVYGRGGQPCRRCGTRIRDAQLGLEDGMLRQVQWCPRCQPEPAAA